MLLRIFSVIGAVLVTATAGQAAAAGASSDPSILTAEEIFPAPSLHSAKLSPEGRYFGAVYVDRTDRGGLLTIDLDSFKQHELPANADFEANNYRWIDDERLLFQMVHRKMYSYGLYVARADDPAHSYPINNYDGVRVVGVPRLRPGRVLVWIVQSAEDPFHRSHGVVELSTDLPFKTDALSDDLILHSYGSPAGLDTVLEWDANYDGDLWLCVGWRHGHEVLFRFLRAEERWRRVRMPDHASLIGPDPDERFGWVSTHDDKKGFQLQRVNLDTGEAAPPVLSDQTYDLDDSRLIFSHRTHALIGVSYLKQQPVTIWLSKNYAAVQLAVDHNYPGTVNTLIGHDRNERRFLFDVSGPQQPGAYVVLDVATKALHLLVESMPWLKGRPLLPARVVTYATRDGVTLEAILTVPPGVDAHHPAPMVVLPHGGPYARDYLGFDPEAQFLASRGYVVLQPNYRGSSGYEPRISNHRDTDYRRMHNDVTDATRFLIQQGLADPKRIAIMGSSFGGYLAVCGVAFEDGLYRCAITEDGVFDWEALVQQQADNENARPGENEILASRFGQFSHDQLMEISPVAHVDRIHVPVLIAHGREDTVVSVRQSQVLATALKEHGVPHEVFIRRGEGHGFYNYTNRVDYYHRVEAFLAANLGGKTLTPVK